MQKIIFFTPIVETGKLATIITDKSVDELKQENIIPINSKFVIKDYNENNLDELAVVYHSEYFKFNDDVNPTDIILNTDILKIAALEDYRTKRSEIFSVLDSLQTRALLSGNTSVASQIEADKTLLRNLPSVIDFSSNVTLRDFYRNPPAELFIDYKAKYESKLK